MDIAAKMVNVNFESLYRVPLMYQVANCDRIAQRCFEAFSSYGLKAAQVAVRRGDEAYNFDVSFVIFNGNGTFKITSEGTEIRLQNVMSPTDLEIVIDCVAKFYEHIPLPDVNLTSVSIVAQATAPSIEDMQNYFLRAAHPDRGISQVGVIAYLGRFLLWSEEIRLAIDRSLLFPEGLFLMWTTKFQGTKITRESLRILHDSCKECARRFDLNLV